MMQIEKHLQVYIPHEWAGRRVDKVLAELIPQYSRTVIQQWLRQGLVRLEDEALTQRHQVLGGEEVVLSVPRAPTTEWAAQAITIDVVYEDDQLLVVNKPAGLVVHPGAGNPRNTLLNGLLYLDPSLGQLPRAGIVHRLDKDTSGLMVVARTERARLALLRQLKARQVKRIYTAVVNGVLISGGSVEAPVGRHRRDRQRMAVTRRGKPAISRYRVIKRYRAHTSLRIELDTGRTHQIRVHLGHAGYPLVGDPVYGGRLRIPKDASQAFASTLRGFRRQALHASQLSLCHPRTEQTMVWEQYMPADMKHLIAALERDYESHDRQGR